MVLSVRDQPSIYDEVNNEEIESNLYQWTGVGPLPWIDWTWHFGESGVN